MDLCSLECLHDAVWPLRIAHVELISRLSCSCVKSIRIPAARCPEIRNNRRWASLCSHGLQLSRVEVFLADHMHTPESATNSLSSGSFGDAAWSTHSSSGKKNAALSFSLSLFQFLARFQALLRAHRCCLSVSSWDLS